MESALPQDLAKTLERLETLLANPNAPECAAALRVQVAALLSWGEVLNLDEFVKLAQATVTLMRLSPEQTPIIAQLALSGFRAIYQLESQTPRSIPPLDQPQLPSPLVPVAISPSAITAPSTPPSSTEHSLNTADLFVWQTGTILFTVPSNQVAEILIPKPDQLVSSSTAPGLRWQHHIIPLYQLVPTPQDTTISEQQFHFAAVPGTATTAATLLVIDQGRQQIALDVDIEALVTDPELTILPWAADSQAPNYIDGYTLRGDDGQPIPVINVVTLLAPICDQPPPSKMAAPPPVESAPQPPPSVPAPDHTAPTIMVVDDSHTLRQILALMLQTAGFAVVQAQDGQEALVRLQENRAIRLIVCDIEMPNMNGFEFLSNCRRDPHCAKLPVVMLSTFIDEQHRQLATTLGANAYFGKPYNETEFLATLRAMIG